MTGLTGVDLVDAEVIPEDLRIVIADVLAEPSRVGIS